MLSVGTSVMEKDTSKLMVFWHTVLLDLSKAYDCIPNDLLIAKLEAYGLDKTSLHLLRDYFSIRKQLTKISFGLFD